MIVKELVRRDVPTLSPGDSLASAVQALIRDQVNCLPLVDADGRPRGVVTIHQILAVLAEAGGRDLRLADIMNRAFHAASEDASFDPHSPELSDRLVVVDHEGRYGGVVTKLDLISRLNQSLTRTQAQLEAILGSVPSGIIAVDSSGRLTMVNPKAEEILGIKAAESLGQPVQAVVPSSDLPRVLARGRAELGLPRRLGEKSLLVSRSPIFDPDGAMVGAVAVFQDESEMEGVQRQLDELRRLNDELNMLLESSHDGVIITDVEQVLKVNASFGRISGLSPDGLEGRRVEDLDASRHICLASVQEINRLVRHHRRSMTVLRKTNRGNEIYVTGSPVLDRHQQVARVVLNIRDVTELRQLEDQIRRLSSAYLSQGEVRDEWQAGGGEMVAESRAMRKLLDLVVRVAKVDSIVLLQGESGVGKDVLARLIHRLSARHAGPFVGVNCGAIPENLLESEFFGYEKGAFTGAVREGKPGLFEQANGGVLFLDEVGELPLNLQVKLLKVLQDQQCRRLGGAKSINLDLRILAATNRRLRELVGAGSFREDLFYRLYVVPIEVPPLRERREDVMPMALLFLRQFNQKYGVSRTLGSDLLRVLEGYAWPGNVRELKNVIERLVVTADSDLLEPRHLPETIRPDRQPGNPPPAPAGEIWNLKQAREDLERRLIAQALAATANTREAAALLGVDHSTVVRKAQRYGLPTGLSTG
ncbi:MAG: sigma 54-interacting transcriptional regulator [Thermodesulfobacteriota bacterium]